MLFPLQLRKLFVCFALAICLLLTTGCNRDAPNIGQEAPSKASVVLGYSSWAGWWPWAIAQEEGLFEANEANVELVWYESYLASLEALAAGYIDANCQTLNDTISYAAEAVDGEVVVLVNDNSDGNDKIVVDGEIDTISELATGKSVGVEAGLVDDFLLTLALREAGHSRNDVNIQNMETGAAAAAFAAGEVDAVGAFPPFWLTALKRAGSKELLSSKDFPGAIPDLLVASQTLIDERPELVQALVATWFDVLDFMATNPERANEIIARRANVSPQELKLFEEGVRFFSLQDNLKTFTPGEGFAHILFAAEQIGKFMSEVDFIDTVPDLKALFDDRFVKALVKKS